MTSLTDKYYSLESEDDFRSGFWTVSHQQQFFSEVPSPKRSHNTNYWYSWVQTIFCETHLLNIWCLLADQASEQRISWCQPSLTICICLNQCIYGWWVFSQHWTWGCLVWGNGNHRQKNCSVTEKTARPQCTGKNKLTTSPMSLHKHICSTTFLKTSPVERKEGRIMFCSTCFYWFDLSQYFSTKKFSISSDKYLSPHKRDSSCDVMQLLPYDAR